MKVIWNRILNEPAIATGVPTVVFASAAGIWNEPWIAFVAAAWAAIGTLFTRQNVTPLNKE